MNKEINQKMLQFLDDELDPIELDDLLLKIKKQPELKNKMSRYQLISHAIKMDQVTMTNTDFLENVNQQLKQEAHHFLPKQKLAKKQNNFWQKTSLAVAASVACVAVILSQQGGLQNTEQPQQMLVAQKKVIEQLPVQAVISSPQVTKQISQHQRLKAYLQAHNDDLYTHGSLNVHPFAQVAGYGQE